MKKILSLLSMLMITVMAFATDYKGQLDYTVKTRTSELTGPSIAQGTLKIEDYAGGKYTVTATGCDLSSLGLGNWEDIVCEGVEGQTDANGVTTIDVTPYALRSSDNAELKNAKLFVKFKADKAYAKFEGLYNPNTFSYNLLQYTFGTDEGFEGGGSTGGGETGGEVTVTFEKQYADKLYSLVDGTPNAMGEATVTLKEMSDNTISMSLAFTGMNVESTDLVKGTDEKERITYTGTANFQGTNFAVKALRYTKDEEEKLYMTLTPTEGTTLAFGTDPDYVAPAEPEDVTLWENYQADGTGFSKTATIDWDKQKIVASIDFSNGGDDKDILAMTTGESFAAFQTSTYRTMHWYCQQSVKQMSGFFAKDGAGNNNTGRMDVADCLAKFEISKAEGLKVNGEVKMSPAVLDELFASNTILIGSGESPKFSQAF